MDTFTEALIEGAAQARVAIVAGVPDGLLAPAIKILTNSDVLRYVACAREEECLGVAAGAAFVGQRGLVLAQNAGLLNALGAYAALLERYRLPVVALVADRGGFADPQSYDIEKHVAFNAAVPPACQVFSRTTDDFTRADIARAFAWAEAARRPCVLAVQKGVANAQPV